MDVPLQRIPELAASRVTERINSGEFSTKLSRQQYLKHTKGTAQYNQYKIDREAKNKHPQSELLISEMEAQQLILDSAGTGIVGVNRKTGEMLPFESITSKKIIGRTWSGDKYVKTRKARIFYGSKSAHIVPIGGMNYD